MNENQEKHDVVISSDVFIAISHDLKDIILSLIDKAWSNHDA